MCSAVFITGLDPDFAAENVGYFTAPYAIRSRLGKPVIERGAKAVHVTLPNGVTRTAKHLGSQGCVTLPVGQNSPAFTPIAVKSRLPDAATQPWPMGDVLPKEELSPHIDTAKVKQAVLRYVQDLSLQELKLYRSNFLVNQYRHLPPGQVG